MIFACKILIASPQSIARISQGESDNADRLRAPFKIFQCAQVIMVRMRESQYNVVNMTTTASLKTMYIAALVNSIARQTQALLSAMAWILVQELQLVKPSSFPLAIQTSVYMSQSPMMALCQCLCIDLICRVLGLNSMKDADHNMIKNVTTPI